MIAAFVAALTFAAAPADALAPSTPLAPHRVALLVGANGAAPGRMPLQFAYDDARSMAAVLRELGGFADGDVEVLLDPEPARVLERLDAALERLQKERGESMLVFYYSGHSDQTALFPRGQALSMESLRKRLDDRRATVRIGILDACRGGSWTGTKGLVAAKPFEVEVPLSLGNEGAVLLASSSGLEDAHESEMLHGSFFTHHLVAALRGAADRAGLGEVTLTEAFEYAKALTVRDSALYARAPQHPSFEMNLRGRRDLPMTRLANAESRMSLEQREGPLRVIQLESGLEVLEVPPGERRVVAALRPGRYLVRRVGGQRVFAREVEVAAGKTTELREQDLQLVGSLALATKGVDSIPTGALTSLKAGTWELRLSAGRMLNDPMHLGGASFGLPISFGVAVSDRVFLSALPFGASVTVVPGRFELLASAHICDPVYTGGSDVSSHLLVEPRLQLLGRYWIDGRQSLIAALGAGTGTSIGPHAQTLPWSFSAAAAYSITLADVVTLNPAVALTLPKLDLSDDFGTRWKRVSAQMFQLGSALEAGGRPVPLVSVHLTQNFSVDGYASIAFATHSGGPRETESFAGGLTWDF